jgi:CHAP domain-containing protein
MFPVIAGLVLALGTLTMVAAPARASCVLDVTGGCAKTYQVTGTNGGLAVQSLPFVNHVTASLPDGASVHVLCQLQGGADPYDGLSSHTWDKIGPGQFVYDWYVTTPPQSSSGWSAGIPRCVDLSAFPFPYQGGYVADGHGYYEDECTSFAAWALRATGVSPAAADWQGNADMWGPSAAYVSAPHAGDIAQWFDNHNGAGGLGHVAYVQSVNGDGTITVFEYNWGAFHQPHTRTISISAPSRYLHY